MNPLKKRYCSDQLPEYSDQLPNNTDKTKPLK